MSINYDSFKPIAPGWFIVSFWIAPDGDFSGELIIEPIVGWFISKKYVTEEDQVIENIVPAIADGATLDEFTNTDRQVWIVREADLISTIQTATKCMTKALVTDFFAWHKSELEEAEAQRATEGSNSESVHPA